MFPDEITVFSRVEEYARTLKENVAYYRNLLSDPDTPWAAYLLLSTGVGYLLMPVDLIPDGIPVIGWLDDVVIVPVLIWLGTQLIPEEVLERHRENNAENR